MICIFTYAVIAGVLGIIAKTQDLMVIFLILGVLSCFIVRSQGTKALLAPWVCFALFYLIAPSPPIIREEQTIHFDGVRKECKSNYSVIESIEGDRFLVYADWDEDCGSSYHLVGTLKPFPTKKPLLQNSFYEYLKWNNVQGELILSSALLIQENTDWRWQMEQRMTSAIDPISARWVSMLVFGNQEIESSLYQNAKSLSILSLFVISGMHFQLLSNFLNRCTKRFKYGSSIVLVLLTCYIVMLNFPIPATRAYLNVLILFLFPSLAKSTRFFLCLLFQLAWMPTSLYLVSFQLSYLVSFFLLFLTQKNIISMIATSCILAFGISPLLLQMSGIIHPLMPLFQIVFSPLIMMAFMFSMVVALMPLTNIVFMPIFYSLETLLNFTATISPPLVVGAMNWLTMSIFFLFMFWYLWSKDKRNKKESMLAMSLAGAMLFVTGYQRVISPFPQVVFLDVGQGDCILLSDAHDRYHILIDTGGNLMYDVAERVVVPYLNMRGIRRLDAILLTHNDFDHTGALPSILQHIEVNQVIDAWKENDMEFGSLKLKNLNHLIVETTDDNMTSAVISFELMGIRFLCMGDAPIEVENYIMNLYPAFETDVIKLGHHGSRTSSSSQFLDWVDPEVAVIMVGMNNHYGHPHQSVLNTLVRNGIGILRTDLQGSIVFQEKWAWFFWR